MLDAPEVELPSHQSRRLRDVTGCTHWNLLLFMGSALEADSLTEYLKQTLVQR